MKEERMGHRDRGDGESWRDRHLNMEVGIEISTFHNHQGIILWGGGWEFRPVLLTFPWYFLTV
jgi:hypothetical protein